MKVCSQLAICSDKPRESMVQKPKLYRHANSRNKNAVLLRSRRWNRAQVMKADDGVVSLMLWPLTPGEKAAGWEPGVNGSGSMGYGRDFGSRQLRTSQSTYYCNLCRTLTVKFRHGQNDQCLTTGWVRLLNVTSIPELLRNASNLLTRTAVTILLSTWVHELRTQL
jgi:hypothetical protein